MNIVLLQDDFPPEAKGGAGIVAAVLAEGLVKRGHTVSVITTTRDRVKVGKSVWGNVGVYRIWSDYPERWRAWRSLYNPRVVREVKRVLEELKPDIVHAHNIHYHLSYGALCAARARGAKVVLTAHDAMLIAYGKIITPPSWWQSLCGARLRFNPLRSLFIRRALSCVASVSAVSEALASALTKAGISRVHVIHNGIAVKDWEVDSVQLNAFKEKHGLANRPILLFGGRMSTQKGGDALRTALPEIIRVVPNLALLLVGADTPYVREFKRQAVEAGFGDVVVSTGWIQGEELRAAYHAATVVAVPSLYLDPLPTVVLEAMACCVPVVGSSFGGISEMVTDGETGYVVDPRDAHMLVERLVSILQNPGLARALGEAGHRSVQERFTQEAYAARVESWYQSLS